MYVTIVHPCSDAAAAFVILMDSSAGRKKNIQSFFNRWQAKIN